jgi:hypothetical protein
MADSAYDSSVPNFQSDDETTREKAAWDKARLGAELESLNRAFTATQSAAEELHDLAKALILRSLSDPMIDLAERSKKLDTIDLVDELRRFLECACLGVESLGSPRQRDGLQAVLIYVIDGLKALSKALHPDQAEAQTA